MGLLDILVFKKLYGTNYLIGQWVCIYGGLTLPNVLKKKKTQKKRMNDSVK